MLIALWLIVNVIYISMLDQLCMVLADSQKYLIVEFFSFDCKQLINLFDSIERKLISIDEIEFLTHILILGEMEIFVDILGRGLSLGSLTCRCFLCSRVLQVSKLNRHLRIYVDHPFHQELCSYLNYRFGDYKASANGSHNYHKLMQVDQGTPVSYGC